MVQDPFQNLTKASPVRPQNAQKRTRNENPNPALPTATPSSPTACSWTTPSPRTSAAPPAGRRSTRARAAWTRFPPAGSFPRGLRTSGSWIACSRLSSRWDEVAREYCRVVFVRLSHRCQSHVSYFHCCCCHCHDINTVILNH